MLQRHRSRLTRVEKIDQNAGFLHLEAHRLRLNMDRNHAILIILQILDEILLIEHSSLPQPQTYWLLFAITLFVQITVFDSLLLLLNPVLRLALIDILEVHELLGLGKLWRNCSDHSTFFWWLVNFLKRRLVQHLGEVAKARLFGVSDGSDWLLGFLWL